MTRAGCYFFSFPGFFSSSDDLNGAGETMKKLFSLPVYMGVINGKQEVMIGYSDSAKGGWQRRKVVLRL